MGEGRRIVVVDDEADLREAVADYLAMHGFEIAEAGNGEELRAALALKPCDLILLDLKMPGEDGLSIARSLRQSSSIPIIMVTAIGETVDRVVGLELGADDYIAKPFDMRELLARIRTVLRRTTAAPPASAPRPEAAGPGGNRVRFGRCWLDLDAHKLYADDGEEVPITSMEFDLLKAFADHPNRVLTRDQLLDLAHNSRWEPFDRSIDIRVARLRRKVEHDPTKPQAIKTVRGAGYMFSTGRSEL